MIRARWFDLGRTDPLTFHATYAGLAEAGAADGSPAVVWGRVAAHVCLGQSQGLCELADALDVPVVRRPLGGGAVWVDEMQLSYALVAPLAHAPVRPADWYAWALAPAIATFRAFGLAAERRAEDLWVAGRKIAGSGAATIGRSAVVASSFLLRFPRERFVRAVAVSSPGFQARLREGLDLAMTDWSAHAAIPGEAGLQAVFRQALEGGLGWRMERGVLEREQTAAIAEWRDELAAPIERGSPRRGGAIKLNAALTLASVDGAAVLLRREPATAAA